MKKVKNGIAVHHAPGQLTGSTLKKQRNVADCEIRPAPSGLKLAFGSTLASTKLKESELDKSHAIYKLCHTKIKSRCIVIKGP